jgi:hypothetical protein
MIKEQYLLKWNADFSVTLEDLKPPLMIIIGKFAEKNNIDIN